MADTTINTLKLPERSVNWLQDLIRVNIDSRDGFKDAADHLSESDPALHAFFRHLSRERDGQVNELQALVVLNADKPTRSGSLAAAAHRTWMDLRAMLGGGTPAILSEAERGEDHIKDKYEAAIHDLGDCACVSTLQKHFVAIKAAHNKVKELRDKAATA